MPVIHWVLPFPSFSYSKVLFFYLLVSFPFAPFREALNQRVVGNNSSPSIPLLPEVVTYSIPSTSQHSFSTCPSLKRFAGQTLRPRSTSRKQSSKQLQPAQSPTSVRTRSSLKRAASVCDLLTSSSPPSPIRPNYSCDKSLVAICAQIKKRKEKKSNLSPPQSDSVSLKQ